MHPRVTAIVVAHLGAERLQRTLDALKAQHRQPDSVIVIDIEPSETTAEIISAFTPTHFLATQDRLSFGSALRSAIRMAPPPDADNEWLWLLAQDSAPEPGALGRLLGTVEVAPSVAVAGPKLVDWDDTSLVRELGESMSPLGASVPLVQDELDQAQHDGLSDVLGVHPAGMLVRHTVWNALSGFDRGLPVVDDGLDFCVRARLAGHRVVLVPTTIVAFAGDGVAGPSRSNRWSNRRRLYRARRAAQLHRRMVYSPPGMVVIHWLSMVPLAIIRSIMWILGKQPGAIGGELAAAFATAFGATHVMQARRSLSQSEIVGWSAIAPLRIPYDEVRRARALKRETAMMRNRGERTPLNFFGGGGAWTVIGLLVLSFALFLPLLGTSILQGGALLPLPKNVGDLWANLGVGWRDIGVGFVGAADPFTAVLAVLGSVTFWDPSFSLVLLWFAAIPLAGLGAWFCAARLTNRLGLRATFAIIWAIAPMLFDALQSGRPTAVLVHLLLPWVFFVAFNARRSWAASATTSLLVAATLACAPSLIPAFVLIWLVWMFTSGRRLARLILIPLPAIVLFAPLVWQQLTRGAWLAVLADPGASLAATQPRGWQLSLGFASQNMSGWGALGDALGLPGVLPSILVAVLLAPIAVLAILALFLRGTIRAVLSLLIALAGFATAVACTQLFLASTGSLSVMVWPGSGLSLYWLGLSAAAILGLGALGRFATAPAWAAVIAAMLAVAPLAAAVPLGNSAVSAGSHATLPAYVNAQAAKHPRAGTLVVTPQLNGGLAAQVVRGTGTTLDDQSTLNSTVRTFSGDQRALARTVGNLASSSGLNASNELRSSGIDFVLLAPGKSENTSTVAEVRSRTEVALDGNELFSRVGSTDYGVLWTVKADAETVGAAAPIPADAGGWMRPVVLTVQAILIALTLLLSIPTGRAERGVLRRPSAAEIGVEAWKSEPVEPVTEPVEELDQPPEEDIVTAPDDVMEVGDSYDN